METRAAEIIADAASVFAPVARPEHFTDYRHCCECREHDEELQPWRPDDIPREALGSMGWDPITFASDQAFRYYLPGMIRIVLTESGDRSYYEQFLWHVLGAGGYDRHGVCTREERRVVASALSYLLEYCSLQIDEEGLADELLWSIEKWSE